MKTEFISRKIEGNEVEIAYSISMTAAERNELAENYEYTDNGDFLAGSKARKFKAEISLEGLGFEEDLSESYASYLELNDEIPEGLGYSWDDYDSYEMADKIIEEHPEVFEKYVDEVICAYVDAYDEEEFLALLMENGEFSLMPVKIAA